MQHLLLLQLLMLLLLQLLLLLLLQLLPLKILLLHQLLLYLHLLLGCQSLSSLRKIWNSWQRHLRQLRPGGHP